MNAPQTVSPRRRLQELQAIPDRQRTEAEWDELHELEISLAPGNRADVAPPRAYTTSLAAPEKPKARARARPGEGGEAKPKQRPVEAGGEGKKTFRKRHRKPAKPGGAGGAAGNGGQSGGPEPSAG